MQPVRCLDHDSLQNKCTYSFAIHVTPETLCQAANCCHNRLAFHKKEQQMSLCLAR